MQRAAENGRLLKILQTLDATMHVQAQRSLPSPTRLFIVHLSDDGKSCAQEAPLPCHDATSFHFRYESG